MLTIQSGEYTINVALISEIDWTVGEEECLVRMVTGKEYTLEGEDREMLIEMIQE